MTDFITAVVLLSLSLIGVVVRKTYYSVPAKELKRRAARHDPLAERLYQAVAYGGSLRSLLWVYISLTSGLGFILLARVAPVWLSLVAVVVLLWAAFSWLPASQLTTLGTKLTTLSTPAIVWILGYAYPLLSRTSRVVEKRYSAPLHTGIFERNDVLQLVERQQAQHDNRISAEKLEIIKRALTFSDRTVSEVLIGRKKIKTALAHDTIGPILIDELHQASQQFVLVRETPKGAIVGLLDTTQLGIQSSGQVQDVMDRTVYYVHEQDTLSEALHAFFVTNHPLFIVVNNFEEYLGIITVETILRELLGHLPGDDFDQYADIKAVAARHNTVAQTEEDLASNDEFDAKVIE